MVGARSQEPEPACLLDQFPREPQMLVAATQTAVVSSSCSRCYHHHDFGMTIRQDEGIGDRFEKHAQGLFGIRIECSSTTAHNIRDVLVAQKTHEGVKSG